MTKLDIIESVVCQYFGVRPMDVREKSRFDYVLKPRQIIVSIASELIKDVDKSELMRRFNLNRATYYNCIKSIKNRRLYFKFDAKYMVVMNNAKICISVFERAACEAATAPDAAD